MVRARRYDIPLVKQALKEYNSQNLQDEEFSDDDYEKGFLAFCSEQEKMDYYAKEIREFIKDYFPTISLLAKSFDEIVIILASNYEELDDTKIRVICKGIN